MLAGFAGLTLPLLPVQAVLKRTAPSAAKIFPHWYHKRVCQLLGVRLDVEGAITRDQPVLIVANHTSWLDIPVLSAVAPVSFVAKKEVGSWPGVAMLANLQRTVYVDRKRRSQVSATAGEIAQRLDNGDQIVLFAEGTSTDGNRVLPFRSSLFAAAMPSKSPAPQIVSDRGQEQARAAGTETSPLVQTLAITYTRLHGIPLSRAQRYLIGWYGDMDMADHAWTLLKSGPIDVAVRIGAPIPLTAFENRKDLAAHTEKNIRGAVTALLRDPHWRAGAQSDT